METQTAGFLYCIFSRNGRTDTPYFKELSKSLQSLKACLPDANVCVFTNIADASLWQLFDNVIVDQKAPHNLIFKAYGLLASPYDKTVFLDTDILVHSADVCGIFDALENFDISVAYGNAFDQGSAFPDYNTGVLGVANNNAAKVFLQDWIDINTANPEKRYNDQWAFRQAYLKRLTSLRLHVLPAYFQYRYLIMHSYGYQAITTHSHALSRRRVSAGLAISYFFTFLCQDLPFAKQIQSIATYVVLHFVRPN